MKSGKYRFDQAYGILYAWFESLDLYISVLNANGKTEEETILEYEERLSSDQDEIID